MNPAYFLFLVYIIVCTLVITYWAAKRSKTTPRFYVASGKLTGFQNGLAIAGDFISAASFLGIAGMIALAGMTVLYSIGFLASYLFVLFLVASRSIIWANIRSAMSLFPVSGQNEVNDRRTFMISSFI